MNLNLVSSYKVTFACFVFLVALFLTGDLAVAVYSLFVAGVIMYFIRSNALLLKIGGVALLTALIYPLIGMQIGIIVGFLGVLVVFKKGLDGRFAFGVAIFFLVLCPVLLAVKQDLVAEGAAIFAYYFLATGTIQEIIGLVINPQDESK